LTPERREHLEYALIIELQHAADALDLIEIDENRCGKELSSLLYHMLQVALPRKTHEVLFPTEANPPKKASEQHS
jgi:hypothetical protein